MSDVGDGDVVAPLRVALLGCGVVGTEVARLLTGNAIDLAARVGRPLELVGIAVRRPTRRRDAGIDPDLFTTDALDLVRRADVVVEVIGGIEPARTLILEAMRNGAGVVTANKALLAEDGPTLYEAADEHGVDLYFEAAVAGAIPLVRPVRESMAGDRIDRVLGIVNGTTNYVLDQMDTTGAGFEESVQQAQALGYAEADPTADVEGFDAAAKAAILAVSGVPHPGERGRRAPRGHHRRQRRRRRGGEGVRLRGEAPRDLRAHQNRWGRSGLGARPPGHAVARAPARQRPRRVQRGVRRGRGRGFADVLRRRRGRPAHRQRGARRRRGGRAAPRASAGADPARAPTPTCPC